MREQDLIYKIGDTYSYRDEDYRLADFLNESPPFNSKFSIYSEGFDNPKTCGGSAYTQFNITHEERAAAFSRNIEEFDCSTKWERRGSNEPPEGSVFWKYKQWFADWERPDPLIYLLISSSTYEIVYVCETRCEGFDGTLTYYREYVLLRMTETGVMFVTIPVAVYEFTNDEPGDLGSTLNYSLRDVFPTLDNQLEVTLSGSTGFTIKADADSANASQLALVGEYQFDTFSNDAVPKCTMLDTKYFQLGCYYTSN